MEPSMLAKQWVEAKETERIAVDRRRVLEDQMVKYFKINIDEEGTENIDVDQYRVKVVSRMNRKVDSDRLQEIAAEAGLTDHLSSLFRWKAEINTSAWKASDKEITVALSDAITVSAGRPTFNIEVK